jgi:hypothetical protein
LDCARWKADRDEIGGPRLTRKFGKWSGEGFTHNSSLVMSLLHPISRLRMESHVAMIRLKELPSGFRILSARAVSIESLPDDVKKDIREGFLSSKAYHPEQVRCMSLYVVEAINADNNCTIPNCYGLGIFADLAAIQDIAAAENGRQADLIKMLNKEL